MMKYSTGRETPAGQKLCRLIYNSLIYVYYSKGNIERSTTTLWTNANMGCEKIHGGYIYERINRIEGPLRITIDTNNPPRLQQIPKRALWGHGCADLENEPITANVESFTFIHNAEVSEDSKLEATIIIKIEELMLPPVPILIVARI